MDLSVVQNLVFETIDPFSPTIIAEPRALKMIDAWASMGALHYRSQNSGPPSIKVAMVSKESFDKAVESDPVIWRRA